MVVNIFFLYSRSYTFGLCACSFYNPVVYFILLQAQKRKLGLLDDEDKSNLEDTVSNKKQNFGENLPNNRGVLDLSY